MKPRKAQQRSFGCPPVLWFDDPDKVHHFTGRSVDTLERWAEDGLRVHQVKRGDRLYRYVVTEEFLSFLAASEERTQRAGGAR